LSLSGTLLKNNFGERPSGDRGNPLVNIFVDYIYSLSNYYLTDIFWF